MSHDKSRTKDNSKSPSIFVTLLISRILTESAHKYSLEPLDELLKTCRTAVRNLTSPKYSWDYFGNNKDIDKDLEREQDQRIMPPDDLDSTCNALYTLLYRSQDTNTAVDIEEQSILISNLVRHLLTAEHKLSSISSAYNTWILDNFKHTKFFDVDPVVQVIIHKTLWQIDSIPKNFENFLNLKLSKLLKAHKFWDSKYYNNRLYVLSEISSLHSTKAKLFCKKMLRQLLSERGSFRKNKFNIMDKILHLQCKINIGEQLKLKDIFEILILARRVMRLGQSDSNLTNIPSIYTDKIANNRSAEVYSGSFVIALYIRLICSILGTSIGNQHKDSQAKKIQAIKESIYRSTKLKITHTIGHFENSEEFLSLIFKSNDQIKNIVSELFEWYSDLKNNITDAAKFNRQDYEVLSQASFTNSYTWVAYTTYDSIIDREIDSRFIPIANLCLHRMDNLMRDCIKDQDIRKWSAYSADKLLSDIKELLTETNKGLFRDGILSYRINPPRQIESLSPINQCKSIGHCIGPTLLLRHIHPKIAPEEIKHFISFYRNLLSARQLSDDAHDWETDMGFQTNLKAGKTVIKIKDLIASTRYTPATRIILDEVYYSKKYSSNISLDFEPIQDRKVDINNLRKIFTKIALPKILKDMQKYSKESENELFYLNKYISAHQRKYWTDKVKKYEYGVAKAMIEILVLEKLDPGAL